MAELEGIGLVTADVAEICRFYRKIGLDIPELQKDEQHFQITLPGGLRLMWDDVAMVREIDPEWEQPTGQRAGLAFRCADAADVDATYARVVDAGFAGAREPWAAFWGQRYAQMVDPDGAKVDLFAPL